MFVHSPNPPFESEKTANLALAVARSPKSDALPVDEIVTNCITFIELGVAPPNINERVWFDAPFKYPTPCSKSPKSIAFPLAAIVMKSIIFVLLGVDPKNIPLVLLPFAPTPHPSIVLSPKSCALPSVAMVTKSIKFSANGDAGLAWEYELPA